MLRPNESVAVSEGRKAENRRWKKLSMVNSQCPIVNEWM